MIILTVGMQCPLTTVPFHALGQLALPSSVGLDCVAIFNPIAGQFCWEVLLALV